MGQKVNPIGLRLGINRTWDSRWFANTGEYGKLLHEDIKIRKYLEKELKQAAISKVVIERPHKKCRVTIHAARPGLIIGKNAGESGRKVIINTATTVPAAAADPGPPVTAAPGETLAADSGITLAPVTHTGFAGDAPFA